MYIDGTTPFIEMAHTRGENQEGSITTIVAKILMVPRCHMDVLIKIKIDSPLE
jgi:hypothetical protein